MIASPSLFVISTSYLFVISTEGRNLALGTGSGRKRIQCRQLRFLAPLEMTVRARNDSQGVEIPAAMLKEVEVAHYP